MFVLINLRTVVWEVTKALISYCTKMHGVSVPRVKLFVNMLSQPARMVLMLCELAKVPYEKSIVQLDKGEQQSPEFLKVNPNGMIPALQCLKDPNFTVFESTSILRYLHNLYPQETKALWLDSNPAHMEEFFNYYHTSLRKITEHFRAAFLWSRSPDGPELTKRYGADLEAFTTVHLQALGPAIHKYSCLTGKITAADIVILCEVMQLNCSGFPADKLPQEFRTVTLQKFKSDPQAYKIARDLHTVVEKMCAKRKYVYWLDQSFV